MKYTMCILTFALIFHAFIDRVYADTPPIWDTRSLATVTSNSQPVLHGMWLVWQAKGGLATATSTTDDWEIFAYDLTLETVTQLTDDTSDDTLPRTDGTSIVWQKFVAGTGNQIYCPRSLVKTMHFSARL